MDFAEIGLIARAGFPVRQSAPVSRQPAPPPSRRIAEQDLSQRPKSELGRRSRLRPPRSLAPAAGPARYPPLPLKQRGSRQVPTGFVRRAD